MPEPALSELARNCKRKRETGHRVSAFFTNSKPKPNPDPKPNTNSKVNTKPHLNAGRKLECDLDPSSRVSVAVSSRHRRLPGQEVAALLRQYWQEEDQCHLSWEDLI